VLPWHSVASRKKVKVKVEVKHLDLILVLNLLSPVSELMADN